MTPAVDPITLEVIHNRLDSIVREMANITLRSARSPVIHSGRDFSCGIFNDRCELLAIGTSIPIHIFPMLWQLRLAVAQYEGDIRPGDIFVGNDPHDGGTHLNDVLLFTPIFSGGELFGFACNRAHWYDVGGMVPGSISGFAREIFQEGLRIPPLRLGRDDQPDADLLRFISRNVRMPGDVIGDLWAQLASCRVATRRIVELVDRYGAEVVRGAWDEVLATSERRIRARIAALPATTVTHEGYLDNDGVAEPRLRLRVAVRVAGDGVTVDYAGSAPQTQGCLNVSRALAEGFAFMGVKAALDPKGPVNSGCFRPVRVEVPDDCCLNAKPPAAGGGMCEVGQAAIITMVALSALVPDQVSAEEGASAHHQNFDGLDVTRAAPRPFVFYDALSSGCGARSHKDGLDFVRTIRAGNYTAMSVEALEHVYPFVFQAQRFRRDSGGAGTFRGGRGLVREYRVRTDGVISALSDHALVPPAGVHGGQRGAPTRWEVVRTDGRVEPVSARFGSKGALPVRAGEVVRVCTTGGGGWGDPLRRDPERVLADVLDGAVSRAQARDVYGVVVDERGRIDGPATAARREELRAGRPAQRAERGPAAAFRDGVRRAWVAPGADGIRDGELIEVFVPPRPQPLTLIACEDDGVRAAVRLDAEVWEELGLDADTPLWCRPLAVRA